MGDMAYRIYVRLKSGGQATGRELHRGPLPEFGTELDVPLTTGPTVKARIGFPPTELNKPGSTGVSEVFADEI
jgi:hypothetical protein